jgi:hypothetical protein
MIFTRFNLIRGEGQLIEPSYQLSIRRTIHSPEYSTGHSPIMTHEESHEIPTLEYETFWKIGCFH